MSALAEYLREQGKQIELLERARIRDMRAWFHEVDVEIDRDSRGRKILTARDIRRRWSRQGAILFFPRLQIVSRKLAKGHEALQIGGLSRTEDGHRSLLRWHRAAIREALQDGTANVVLPKLIVATKWHFKLIQLFQALALSEVEKLSKRRISLVERQYIRARSELELLVSDCEESGAFVRYSLTPNLKLPRVLATLIPNLELPRVLASFSENAEEVKRRGPKPKYSDIQRFAYPLLDKGVLMTDAFVQWRLANPDDPRCKAKDAQEGERWFSTIVCRSYKKAVAKGD